MKTILFVLLSLIAFNKCMTINGERGNRNIQSKEYDITDFTSIEVKGSAKMFYEQKTDQPAYLQIETDENLIPYITAEVKNGKLFIGTTQKINSTHFIIKTNSKSLSEASMSGSGIIDLKNKIHTDRLDIRISGSGTVESNELHCDYIKVHVSGSGRAKLKGQARNSNFYISGSGTIESSEFILQNSEANISGSGKIKINVTDSLHAKVSGSGNIIYSGNPAHIDTKVSGSGKIKAQ